MPLFRGLTYFANPALEAAKDKAPVVLYTNEFHGFGEKMGATISDAFTLYKPSADKLPSYKARQFLIKRGVPFEVQQEKPEGPLVLAVGDKTISGFDDNIRSRSHRCRLSENGEAGECQFRGVVLMDRYPKCRSKLRVATRPIMGYRVGPYEGVGIFKMGRCARYLRRRAFRLRINYFCRFPYCALVAADLHGADLFHQHLLEYQRDLAQFSA